MRAMVSYRGCWLMLDNVLIKFTDSFAKRLSLHLHAHGVMPLEHADPYSDHMPC